MVTISFTPPAKSVQTELKKMNTSTPAWSWQTTHSSYPGEQLDGDGSWGVGTNEYRTPKITSVTLTNCTIAPLGVGLKIGY